MSELELYINSYFGIPSEDLSTLSNLFKEEALEKNDFFTKKDQYCKKLSFIRSGHCRVFAYNEKGEDITQWISSKGEFITDLSSMVFNTPSRWNIQALTPCALYTITKTDYDRIGDLVPKWKDLEKLFIAKCFLTLEDRVFSFLSMSAEERYNLMMEYKPELFNEVPLHYLASILGMTPETLSRIRRKAVS